MAKNTQPVLKRARTLGIEPGFMGIDKKSKRNPNQSRRKKSEYAGQLNEKQKVKFVYGLLESSSEIPLRRQRRDRAVPVKIFSSCWREDLTT